MSAVRPQLEPRRAQGLRQTRKTLDNVSATAVCHLHWHSSSLDRRRATCAATTRLKRGGKHPSLTNAQKQKHRSIDFALLRASVLVVSFEDFSFLFALREGGHAPCEESWLVHASQPQSTHTLPCLVCHSVLIYDTREAPCSSLGGLSGRSLRRTLRVQVVA
jgi:hypothetical protein